MAIDPVTGALIMGGADFVGNLFGGGESESDKLAKERLREDRLQSRGATAVGLQRQIDANPMRDRLMFNLMQRLGMSPGQFRPTDLFNGAGPGSIGTGPVSPGGVDQDLLAAKRAAYTDGAGGQTTGVAEDFLSRLGYGANPLREPRAAQRPDSLGGMLGAVRGMRDERREFDRRMGGY